MPAGRSTVVISHHTKVCFLLSIFTFFWSWQIAQPVLDGYLPAISIGHRSKTLLTSEIISQYVGACTLLSAYTLFYVVSNGYLTFTMNIAFLFAGFMLACGHGVHVACVTIQKQMSSRSPLYELVYFLHEYWSHNTFLIGFYGIVFLLIWAERVGFKQPRGQTVLNHFPLLEASSQGVASDETQAHQPTPEGTAANNKAYCGALGQECGNLLSQSTVQGLSTELLHNHVHPPPGIEVPHGHTTHTISDHSYNYILTRKPPSSSTLLSCSCTCRPTPMIVTRLTIKRSRAGCTAVLTNGYSFFTWFIITWTTRVWPVLLGVYFSAFASMTSTKPLASLFYFGVLSSQMPLYKKLSFTGLSDFLRLCDNDMVISGFFTKAVLVGIPLMLLDFE